jgi:hypothetical protein
MKVIYIMGDGRSGSTVLSIILGNHPSIESVGELNRWPQFSGQTKPGNRKVEDEAFWKAVRYSYQPGEVEPDYAALVDLQGEFENYKNFPKVFLPVLFKDQRERYNDYLFRLFCAVQSIRGREVIVDETKRPGRGYMLLRDPRLDVRIIHLVRDPRGVMYSQLKTDVEHKFKAPPISMLHYLIKNVMSECVRLLMTGGSVLRVRYEDLALNPEKELVRISRFIGISMDSVIHQIISGEPLTVPHLLDGNRIRHQNAIKLRFDDEWRRKLGLVHKLIAIIMTLPLFLLYNYWNYPHPAKTFGEEQTSESLSRT